MEALDCLYDDMKLTSTPDFFYVESAYEPQEVLVIDKKTSKASVVYEKNYVDPKLSYRPVCGILGTIRLLSGNYLIVATHRIQVGDINKQEIFQLASYDILPYSAPSSLADAQQLEDDNRYMKMVKSVLSTPFIYFSYEYDLTHTMQRLYNTSPEFIQMPMAKRADPRFMWNGHMLQEFNDPQFQRFVLPIMLGFVSINECNINGKMFTWTLISRRSIQRAGPRLFMRGIDHRGHVANYVETEQIVEYNGSRSSFVQTRGSIPLFWSQLPNLKYKPRPRLNPEEDHMAACRLHMSEQTRMYGEQVLVNLIDQTGSEEALETAYRNAINQLSDPAVRYESFDFHSECRNLKWHRLDVLIDRLDHEQDKFSYFLLGRNGALGSQQTGTFRTNCIDCLDRTNVVQSMLARRSLDSVLKRFNILESSDNVKLHDNFEPLFKMVWADNADYISVQYSGTGALKTDFTRTGKRTKLGLLKDGYNSMCRYYKNNFSDGFRQDAIDLFLGHYKVKDGEGVTIPCPLRKDKDWKYITFPSVLLIAISMFFASVIFPSEYSTEILLYLLFWGAMIGSTLAIIFKYGKEFVDYPRLRELNAGPIRLSSSGNAFPF
ncbi:phosphatidylinositol-3-phosphatase SAC1 [Arctopsyche grandis]|uniref:phosphatidylinositol-3-phosphatase SAC1 n=1 Tax=Arctopsyche grandis TaxID=121162 RepID=UPI00406DA369